MDKLFTAVFIIAMGIIIYFIVQWGKSAFMDNDIGGNIPTQQEEDESYDDEVIYDEDTEYYNPNEAPALEDNASVQYDEPEDISSLYRDTPTTPSTGETGTKEVEIVTRPKPQTETPKGVTPPPAPQTPKKTIEVKHVKAAQAKYWVLAGSFSAKENAKTRAASVRKAGYEPEVVDFITKGVYTVVAASYNDKSAAASAMRKLKSKKIECYVRTRK